MFRVGTAIGCTLLLFLASCDDDVTGPREAEPDPAYVARIPLVRQGWWWPSLPVRGADSLGVQREAFGPGDRAYQGWHRPIGLVQKRHLDPSLGPAEGREIYTTLEMRVVAKDPSGWDADEFAGMMRGLGVVDMSEARYLQFWIDDGTGYIDPTDEAAFEAGRPGRIHFDFGTINEDFWWPSDGAGGHVLGEWDKEDLDGDGLLGIAPDGDSEDRGLDGLRDSEESADQALPGRPSPGPDDPAGDNFDAADWGEEIFLYINGTEGNRRLDSEDLHGDGDLDLADGFFRLTLELGDGRPHIDPAYEYAHYPEYIQDMREDGRSWRMYRLDFRDAIALQRGADAGDTTPYEPAEPDLSKVSTVRIWYEPEGDGSDPVERRIKFAEMLIWKATRP